MKKNIIFIFYLLFQVLMNYLPAQIPTFQRAQNFGGNSYAIKTDAAGNVVTTGYIGASTDFDQGPATYTLGAFLQDAFVFKTDKDGNFIWAKQFVGKKQSAGLAMCLDPAGNVYVTGYFSDTTDFDPGPGTYTLAATDSTDIFICKLSSSGNFDWARKIGGPNRDEGYGITIDPSGNVYTTGFFRSAIDFDPGPGTFTLGTYGNSDLFILKLDANGNFVWAGSGGGLQDDVGFSITIDPSNNILIGGFFESNADADPGPGTVNITAVAYRDIWILKLSPAGTFIWSKNFGSLLDDIGYAIATDASGNIYTTGVFQGSGDFDPGPGTYSLPYYSTQTAIFISKLDMNGNFVWAKAFNSSYVTEGHAINVDGSGNVYSAGLFGNTTDFDPGPGTYYQNPYGPYLNIPDVYISKLDANGNFVWVRTFGGGAGKSCNGLDLDLFGNFYVTGYFTINMDCDPGMNVQNIYSNTGSAYINKLGPCLITPAAPVDNTPVQNLIICSGETSTLSASGAGSLYWYATSTGTTIIASGSIFTTPPLSTGSYTYYVIAATCTPSPRTPITVSVSPCIGIKEEYKTTEILSIYPNPSSDYLYFNTDLETKFTKINVINSIGQEMITPNEKNRIDISSLSEGIYYIRLENKNGTIYSSKFVKQNKIP